MRRKRIIGWVLIAGLAGLVPFAYIARSRATRSPTPALHLVLDMVAQPKFKAQRGNAMFADGRAMRPRIEGTVAREDLTAGAMGFTDEAECDRVMRGQERGADGLGVFVTKIPVKVSLEMVERGQERYGIYCGPCHGASGYGDGSVARAAAGYQEAGNADAAGAWVKPSSYHTDDLRKKPDGYFFNVITNGVRNMPRYDKQIPVLDRWAIVAYLRALQVSQNGTLKDVPEGQRDAVH